MTMGKEFEMGSSFNADFRMHELAMTREQYMRIMENRDRPLDDEIKPRNSARTGQGIKGRRTA